MHSSSTCRQPSSGNQQTLRQALSYVIPTLSVDVSGSVNSHHAISLAADISSCARLTRYRSVEPVNHGLVDIAFVYQIAQAHDRCISSLGLLSLSRRGGRTTRPILACRGTTAGCRSCITTSCCSLRQTATRWVSWALSCTLIWRVPHSTRAAVV